MNIKFFIPAIIFYNEIKKKIYDTAIFNIDAKNIKEAVEANDKKRLSEIIEAFFNPTALLDCNIESIQFAYESLLNWLFIEFVNYNPDLCRHNRINEFFLTKFKQFNSLNEIVIHFKKLIFLLCDEILKNTSYFRGSDNFAINRALQYIKKNFNKNITMASVANHVCLSYNHFSKLFKEVTGENFIDYITRLRIDKAKELLMDPVYDISDISNMLGYTSPRHFSRVFQNYTSQLPREFRKKSLEMRNGNHIQQ